MPPDNPLPTGKRTLIRLWIEQGAKETTCNSNGPPGNGTKSGTLWACYDRDIQPILMSSCAVSGCHDAATHKEGIDFSSYTKTLQSIKAGNPGGSELYEAITESQSSEHFMPPKPYSPLSKAAIDTIYSWIKRGALNEECASVCDTTGTIQYASHIKSIIDRSCVSCHGATNPSGGIKLLTTADVQTVAKSGRLVGAVIRKSGFTAMPPAYALDNCDVRQIELWIDQGYN
jgi:cytochrome c5